MYKDCCVKHLASARVTFGAHSINSSLRFNSLFNLGQFNKFSCSRLEFRSPELINTLMLFDSCIHIVLTLVSIYHSQICHAPPSRFRSFVIRCSYYVEFQAKDPLNGASVVGAGGESSARAFLTSGKREVSREYPSFAAGLHGLPPTPASPFSHGASNPFNPANKGKLLTVLTRTDTIRNCFTLCRFPTTLC